MKRTGWRLRQSLIAATAFAATGLYIEAELEGVFRPADAARENESPIAAAIDLPALDFGLSDLKGDAPAYARPVFRANRRPLREETVAAAIVEGPLGLDSLRLQGVVIDDLGHRAFISSPSRPEGAWYRPGSEIETWQVEAIDFAGVELRRAQGNGRLGFTDN